MCGMPSASRMMSTGALMPVTLVVPSTSGSERRMYAYAPRQRTATMARSTATDLIKILKATLDRLYADFNYPDSATDPIQIVRRFERRDDREVVGFCASALAFGRVASVLQSIDRLLAIMGDHPADYVRAFDPRRDAGSFDGFVHRWTRGQDLVALVWLLRQMFDRAGSVEGFFAEGDGHAAVDIGPALDSFSTRALALDLRAAYGRVPR